MSTGAVQCVVELLCKIQCTSHQPASCSALHASPRVRSLLRLWVGAAQLGRRPTAATVVPPGVCMAAAVGIYTALQVTTNETQ